jgi:hypothetical protein
MDQYRQGDVFLVKVNSAPKNAKQIAINRLILAEGEVTGHMHMIEQEGAELVQVSPEEVYVKIMETAELKHDEHDTIVVEPGWYRVIQQREYSPERYSRPVLD